MPRLPELLSKDLIPSEKHDVFDYLVKTRGAVSPGYSVLLNNPDAAGRIAQLGTYIRFESSLPGNVRELAALTASAEVEGRYEQALHTRDALANGVNQNTVDAVNTAVAVKQATPEETVAIQCARELIRDHRLSDEMFQQAQAHFGDAGVIDLVATVGYYAMLGYVHNSLEIKPTS